MSKQRLDRKLFAWVTWQIPLGSICDFCFPFFSSVSNKAGQEEVTVWTNMPTWPVVNREKVKVESYVFVMDPLSKSPKLSKASQVSTNRAL
jgi:hypothetical protein